jgi:hypothetical protein
MQRPVNFVLRVFFAAIACWSLHTPAWAADGNCLSIANDHPDLQLDSAVLTALGKANLTRTDFFKTVRIISGFETNGCWSNATGNADGQLLSVGIMQWNFGQNTLQQLLKRYSEKFSSTDHYEKTRDELMPRYGKEFLAPPCRAIPIEQKCRALLARVQDRSADGLSADFRAEIDALFNSPVMRQIQVDYFGRNLTRVLSDLQRVFQTDRPKSWQVAWAMDIKTQQGNKFPTDNNIKQIKRNIQEGNSPDRESRLAAVIMWYEGNARSGWSDGVRLDWKYNVDTWKPLISDAIKAPAREEAVHYTMLVSRTAQNQDGDYQANAFQRRATIVFSRGSVNGRKMDFTTYH